MDRECASVWGLRLKFIQMVSHSYRYALRNGRRQLLKPQMQQRTARHCLVCISAQIQQHAEPFSLSCRLSGFLTREATRGSTCVTHIHSEFQSYSELRLENVDGTPGSAAAATKDSKCR